MKRGRTTTELIRDYSIYVAIGLAVVASSWYAATHYTDSNGLALAWYTLLVFGFSVGAHRRWLRVLRFWFVVSCLLLIHSVGCVIVVTALKGSPIHAWWEWVVFPAEAAAIGMVLDRFGFSPEGPPRRR